MRMMLIACAATTLSLVGCAGQAPESQLKKMETVRVCQGSDCREQQSDTVTFQGEPVDAEAQLRLQALTELAQQDPSAAYDLGLRLLRGDGVQRDSYSAIQWLRKAGDGGLADAQLALGRLYLLGFEEMGADPGEAQAWLSRAADQGVSEAQELLPQAQAAKQAEHADYRVREAERTSWGYWYRSAPYYWYWRGADWYLR